MQSGPEHIEFFFGSQVVGYFEDQPPSSAGQYRFLPFRGPGHLRLVRELARNGASVLPLRCQWRKPLLHRCAHTEPARLGGIGVTETACFSNP